MTMNFDNPPAEEALDNEDGKVEARLRATLYRQDCPNVMVLGEYQLGLLAEAEAARLAVHLVRCPHCQEELSRLTQFLAEDVPISDPVLVDEEANWVLGDGFKWRHIKETGQVIIQLMAETLNTALANLQQRLQPPIDQPAFGQLRGQTLPPLFQMALKEGFEDLETFIIVNTTLKDPEHCTVTVEVNIPSQGGWPNLRGTEVALKQNDLKLTTQITDAFGRAVFKGIATDELTKLNFEITPPANL